MSRQGCIKALFIPSCVLLLCACSQQFSAVNDTFSEAILGIPDVALSKQQVDELPYASSYVRINDGSRVFMVLAFADTNPVTGNTQLKWASTDKAIIVTENGRIVKTSMLPTQNLANISSPILTAHWKHPSSWQGIYDWQSGYRYGYQAKGVLTQGASQTLTSVLWQKPTTLWQEHITFPSLSQTITNQYWVDTNHHVVKSIQYVGPNMTKIEMEILKPFGGQ